MMGRNIFAFLVAPFPAALFQAIAVAIWPKPGMGVFERPASMFVAICLLFYVFGLFLGVPLFLALGKRRPRTLRFHALTGMAVALAPIIAVLAWNVAQGPALFAWAIIYDTIYFAMGGLLAGATFWLVARPDRKTKAAERDALVRAFADQPDG